MRGASSLLLRRRQKRVGQPMNVAVVDEGGNLIAFEQMVNAWPGSIYIAGNAADTRQMIKC
jgi:uncharacterized protein GlcG (DUF336 family)